MMQTQLHSKLPPPVQAVSKHRFSAVGFICFCAGFAALATFIDSASPASSPKVSSQSNVESASPQSDTQASVPASHGDVAKLGNGSDAFRATDTFNRRRAARVPWVLDRVNSTAEAQTQLRMRQEASAAKQERREAAQRRTLEQKSAAQRRQQEIDRFTESRRMAHEGLNRGSETPRGRPLERNMAQFPPSRQRSMSTASSASASSWDSF